MLLIPGSEICGKRKLLDFVGQGHFIQLMGVDFFKLSGVGSTKSDHQCAMRWFDFQGPQDNKVSSCQGLEHL
jgi:hypothetical protein